MENIEAINVLRQVYRKLTPWKFFCKLCFETGLAKGHKFLSLILMVLSAITLAFAFTEDVLTPQSAALVFLTTLLVIASFFSWDNVIKARYPQAFTCDGKHTRGRHSNRAYPRFLQFKQECSEKYSEAKFTVGKVTLDAMYNIIKSEREYDDVEWGISEAFRKMVLGGVAASLAGGLGSLLFKSWNNEGDYNAAISTFLGALNAIITYKSLAIVLSVISLGTLFLCFISISSKKEDRELLLFLTWWKESHTPPVQLLHTTKRTAPTLCLRCQIRKGRANASD